jgi:hypothetical protein
MFESLVSSLNPTATPFVLVARSDGHEALQLLVASVNDGEISAEECVVEGDDNDDLENAESLCNCLSYSYV